MGCRPLSKSETELLSSSNCKIMIIDFNQNFKSYNSEILENYRIFSYICPSCGARHSLIRHGKYVRNISFINEDNFIEEKSMTVLRLLCKSCNKTHAVLPNDVIPYCIYSFSFMINVLTKKFIGSEKISSICTSFNISFQLIYSFISRFLRFADSCLLVLRNLGFNNTSPDLKQLLISLIDLQRIGHNFLHTYFSYSSWIFLMIKFQNILPHPIYIGGTG